MEISALLHRPESEYAYLYTKEVMHIRFRTKKDDVYRVTVVYGDPYILGETHWQDGQLLTMKCIATTTVHDYWQVSVTAPFNRLAYTFIVEDFNGTRVIYGEQGVVEYSTKELTFGGHYFRLPYFHDIDRVKVPKWVKETVWYQIFPERFANGNPSISPANVLDWESKEHPSRTDFFGGDLQGVLDHLDYLQDLGVTGLYLCPIFQAGTNHKYDTINYMEIDEHFGDKQLFKQLVDEAHRRGMKIMLDAVFNHLGHLSMQWQDVLANQERSKYVDWFHILRFPVGKTVIDDVENTKYLEYETFGFSSNMPKLNTANKEVQDYLLSIATYWIKEFHIDAWRLDVANEVDHQFWKKFHQETTAINPDVYILGEIWHSSQSWLNGDEFHAVMNYAFTDNIKDCFITKTIQPSRMVSQLQDQTMLYRKQTSEVMFNLLDSHDTPRILTLAKNNVERVKAALAFMFMQQGTPCIYYGTEVGMTGEGDPDCRKPMWWNEEKQDKKMLSFTKQLISFRNNYAQLLSLGSTSYYIDDKTQLVSVVRKWKDIEIIGHFNLGEQAIQKTGKIVFANQQTKDMIQPNEFIIEEV